MKNGMLVTKRFWPALFAVLIILSFTTLSSAKETNTWQNEISVYGWLSGVDGTVQLPGSAEADISVDVSDLIEDLKMVFMGGYKGKYDRWSILTDVVYMDVGGSESLVIPSGTGTPAGANISLDLKSWVISGAAGYDLIQNDSGTLALVGGVRYLYVDVDVDVNFLGQSESKGLLDGVVGVSGSINLSENWYIPYHADIGTGATNLSWQLYAAVGYRLDWCDILVGYRYLSFDISDDDIVIEDLAMSGPVLGLGFKF